MEVLANWFNGNEDESYDFLFYNGMDKDVTCIVNEDGVETEYNGKEAAYGNILVFANLDNDFATVEEDQDGNLEMICDGISIKLETNEGGRITKINMFVKVC